MMLPHTPPAKAAQSGKETYIFKMHTTDPEDIHIQFELGDG